MAALSRVLDNHDQDQIFCVSVATALTVPWGGDPSVLPLSPAFAEKLKKTPTEMHGGVFHQHQTCVLSAQLPGKRSKQLLPFQALLF